MGLPSVAPTSVAEERAHLRLCGVVTLETMACFAVPALVLVVGTMYSPALVVLPFTYPPAWFSLAQFLLGWAGFIGVGRLLHLLWNRPLRDARRWLTLSAVACGSAASLIEAGAVWMGATPGGLELLLPLVYVPLACAAHLVYLNRRALLTRGSAAS